MVNKLSGFTLIEIVISIAIISIIVALLFGSFKNTDDKKSLEASAQLIQSTLDEARARAVLGTANDSHGVHFDSDSVTIFIGDTYTAGESSNESFDLNKNTTITNISLNGGGDEVVFNQLNGETNQYGSVTLSNNISTTTVSIKESGFVDIE